MKIDINLSGTPAEAGDYRQLRAALLAAQAATPTAQAAQAALEPRHAVQPRVALEQLLANGIAAADLASSLEHRFAPDLNGPESSHAP